MSDDQQTIHILNRFSEAASGSAWEAVSLYDELSKDRAVRLWATKAIGGGWARDYPVTRLRTLTGKFPRKGTLIFVGPPPGLRWFRFARPRRVIMLCNYLSKKRFHKRYAQLSRPGGPDVEVVYCSELVRDHIGKAGRVHWSPIDLERFVPRPARSEGPPFTVGRLSRDAENKYGEDDPGLFKALAAEGVRVRLLGGTCQRGALGDTDGIELLEAGSVDAVEFLHSLDALVYRTSRGLTEGWGRVVAEAMACGLPVVVESRGGYVAMVEQGKNGFLFQSNEEALSAVRKLRDDHELYVSVAQAARERAERAFSAEAQRENVDYYLS